MDNSKEFQIGVADVIIRDVNTKDIIAHATALINSSIKQDVQNKEIRGGMGSDLQYEYEYGKNVTADLESCTFEPSYFALVNGAEIQESLQDFFIFDEKHEVKSGKVTLNETPVGKVCIETDDERFDIQPNGKEVTISLPENTEVRCVYQYNTSVEHFTIEASKFANTYDVTFITKMCNKKGPSGIMQINIPLFKISGNFEISLTHDGVASSKMSGKALEHLGGYAKVMIKRTNAQSTAIKFIGCENQDITLNNGGSVTLSFIGVKGGMYANVNVPNSDIDFTSDKISVAKIDATGKVSYVANGVAIITATLKSNSAIKDVIKVTCS